MAWLRYHYHCEQCAATWLAEAEVKAGMDVVADCTFCGASDVFAYRSDAGRIGRATLAVVAGTKESKTAKTPPRAGKLKRSA
jgi:copper oxidase (laccase) domain-containing protein